jgi:hypothetical protein
MRGDVVIHSQQETVLSKLGFLHSLDVDHIVSAGLADQLDHLLIVQLSVIDTDDVHIDAVLRFKISYDRFHGIGVEAGDGRPVDLYTILILALAGVSGGLLGCGLFRGGLLCGGLLRCRGCLGTG